MRAAASPCSSGRLIATFPSAPARPVSSNSLPTARSDAVISQARLLTSGSSASPRAAVVAAARGTSNAKVGGWSRPGWSWPGGSIGRPPPAPRGSGHGQGPLGNPPLEGPGGGVQGNGADDLRGLDLDAAAFRLVADHAEDLPDI